MSLQFRVVRLEMANKVLDHTLGTDCQTIARLHTVATTAAALLENNETSTKLTTANGGTFTSSSARLSSQSRYSTLDQ